MQYKNTNSNSNIDKVNSNAPNVGNEMPLLSQQLISSEKSIPGYKKEEKENLEEIYLSPIKYDDLKSKNNKDINHETFCEGFFIASFPKKVPEKEKHEKDTKDNNEIPEKESIVIEKSQSIPAPCNHKECASLPSMMPKIIYRYPLEDTKTIELNDLAATICFPTGIKVCYEKDESNEKEKKDKKKEAYYPNKIKDYLTPITNQKGERYYMLTYHFYLKLDNYDYNKEYEMHPLKDHLMNFANDYLNLSERDMNKRKKKIEKDLEEASALGNSAYVFVPYCICLISKYPYVNEIKLCLQSIYQLLINEKAKETDLNNLIMHLINSVPIPENESKVRFYIPYCPNEIELKCPKLNDIALMNTTISDLLKLFSIDYIIIIFRLLLFEKKILFIDDDYTRLNSVTDNFISLLYPFRWIHTYIPIMSIQMIQYLESYLPFINGINSILLPWVTELYQSGDLDNSEEIFLIYIKESKFRLGTTLIGKNRRKKYKYIEENIPDLPINVEKNLKNKLKKIKEEIDYNEKKNIGNYNTEIYGLKIRIAFIEAFVEMFSDIEKYLTFLDEDVVFNKNLFLEKISQEDKKFYDEFLDSQLFQLFTQNIIKDDLSYFKNMVDDYNRNGKKFKTNKLDYELTSNKKLYIITPDYLDINSTGKKNKQILDEINKKYELINNDDINHRTTFYMQNIENKNYINDNLNIYIIPKEKKEIIENKRTFYLINKISSEKDKNKKYMKPLVRKYILAKYKENEMSQKDQDELKERIKDFKVFMIIDFTVKIFKSENINTEDKKLKNEMINDLNTKIGREFFINLLSKNTTNIILLQENFFNLLGTLIYNILLTLLKEEGPHILEEVVRLLKSLKYFGKEEKQALPTLGAMINSKNQSTLTLWDIYKQRIQGYAKVNQANLWYKWYQIDLIAEKENNKDEIKIKVILNLCRIMMDIKLDNSFIKKTLDKLIDIVFEKNEKKKEETSKNIKAILSNKYNKK